MDIRMYLLVALAFSVASFGGSEKLSEFKVFAPTPQALNSIAADFEITHRHGNDFTVLVPESRRGAFKTLAPSSELVLADSNAFLRAFEDPTTRGYHSFETVRSELSRLAGLYPGIAQLTRYGSSKEQRPLLALKISDNVSTLEADEPEILLTAATHGDELITVEVLLGILNLLVEGYAKKDPRLTRLVEGLQIYFIPVVNPDGYSSQSRYANGVDPNRDYPWPEKPSRTPNECIANLIQFFHAHNFKGSIDFHASGEMIMYPWAYTDQSVPAADATLFHSLTKKMAAFNDYVFGPISEVIYVAKGSSADYYYWKARTLSLGIEMARSKAPSASTIPDVLSDNTESTWAFVENFL